MSYRAAADCPACAAGLYGEPSPECYHEHPQVLVDYPLEYDLATTWGTVVGVDRGVVPVLQSLWAAGVRTWVSCQGDGYGMAGYVGYHHEDHEAAQSVMVGIWPARYLKIYEPSNQGTRWRTGVIRFPSVA